MIRDLQKNDFCYLGNSQGMGHVKCYKIEHRILNLTGRALIGVKQDGHRRPALYGWDKGAFK
jgi:hypothetical protein